MLERGSIENTFRKLATRRVEAGGCSKAADGQHRWVVGGIDEGTEYCANGCGESRPIK